jgi:hypothetical protein
VLDEGWRTRSRGEIDLQLRPDASDAAELDPACDGQDGEARRAPGRRGSSVVFGGLSL